MGTQAKSTEMREARILISRSVEKIEDLTNTLLQDSVAFRNTLQDAVTEDINNNIKEISILIQEMKDIIEKRANALEKAIVFFENLERNRAGG